MWGDEDWLAELRRDGLIGELLASGTIGQAAAEGGHGHRLERALTAEMTLLCLAAGALLPGQGYDLILARAFSMPGTRVRPGTPVPTGQAFSQARTRLGEQPMRRAFELDAARDDVPLAAGGTAFGLELVIFDGTKRQETNLRKDHRRTRKMANRGSRLRPHYRPVEPTESRHKSEELKGSAARGHGTSS